MNAKRIFTTFFLLASLGLLASAAPAPDFTLTGQKGNAVTLSDYKGTIVVLEWINPDCPFVQRHYKAGTMVDLAGRYGEKGVVWLAINSTHYMGRDDNVKWAEKNNVPYPILDDHEGKAGKAYSARTTPHMFVIDKSGNIVYQGGIDDDPRGAKKPEERTQYVAKALDDLFAGLPVAVHESKPYGCSVKYAKEEK